LALPEIEKTTGGNSVRIKRQLVEQAIGHGAAGRWAEAAETNRKILEFGPDPEAENRLAKSLWEQGELGDAREHYQVALALDPTNRIAERNIERLRVLMSEAGDKNAAPEKAEKAPVAIFVEETGKTGFAMLTDLASPRALAHVNPGDSVELKLLAEGNKYSAGITSLGDRDVRIVIREIFQDPRNYGKVSFPTAARSSDLRPYTKGTLLREEESLEEDLDDDDDDDEIQDLDRVLPAEVTGEEAFEDDVDEVDEP
jgi:tetratricopeptide (TPR) repeat protein